MATLNTEGVSALGFAVDTEITLPDGNKYTAIANQWYGVPRKTKTLTVDPAGDAMCMVGGFLSQRILGSLLQVMTVDEVRQSV